MPKISVIIPIYKVEQYIERCARSLFEQTLDDIEYIFVNDCTPDRSIDVLNSVLEDYPNRKSSVLILDHEINLGLTHARNTGLSYASGEYIAHCDSDDWVEKEMYQELYNQAKESNSDVVFSDFYLEYKDVTKVYKAASFSSNKVQMMRNYISSIWTSLVNMIVKRTLYIDNELKSPEHICYCEDFWLSVRLFFYASKVTKIDKAYYHYNQCNESSIMHGLKKYKGDDMKCYLETIDFLADKNCLNDLEEVMSWRVLNALHFDMYFPEKHREIKLIFPDAHNHILSCPYYTRKQKIMLWLIVHNCRLPVLCFIFMRNLFKRPL